MPPKFIYFDLGRVLLDFTAERMCRQIGEVAGLDAAAVEEAIFGDGLQAKYELGEISTRAFYDAFCERTGTRPDFEALTLAASDIFEPMPETVALAVSLRRSGCRLGILSNTCEAHWEHVVRQFPQVVEPFRVHALSYRIGAAKPHPAIFLAAAELAGAEPGEIFFTDDTAGHVEGARAAGVDAVHFTSAGQLARELLRRGVVMDEGAGSHP